MKIGFIGLGAMGAPMAQRVVAAGHALRGFDLRAAALDALVAAGGQAAASAADAARDAELLWLMVSPASRRRRAVRPRRRRGVAQARSWLGCAGAGARRAPQPGAAAMGMLDAPVSGGAGAAALTIMCAGDGRARAARPVPTRWPRVSTWPAPAWVTRR
jgi:3-hydroxyisobutyrate dehydrogenase